MSHQVDGAEAADRGICAGTFISAEKIEDKIARPRPKSPSHKKAYNEQVRGRHTM